MGLSEEEYGYVLEGVKPVSLREFYPLDGFPVPKDVGLAESEFTKTLLVQEVVPVWKRLCAQQGTFALKAVASRGEGSAAPLWEVGFIHVPKLREVIGENIDLFRYVLGPMVEVQGLVDRIVSSGEKLADVLKQDQVLMGIVLGFGAHNSVVGGRSEKIFSHAVGRDFPPFSSGGLRMQRERGACLAYGGYYLDLSGGGDDGLFRRDFVLLEPSSGFVSIEEEERALEGMSEPFPRELWEKPGFVFGAFKGGPANGPFFERLQKVQKKTRALLEERNFLEGVLERMGGERPVIVCDRSGTAWSPFSVFVGKAGVEEWVRILGSVANRFQGEEGRRAFIEAFRRPTRSSRRAPGLYASQATLEGLKRTLCNLAAADGWFEGLAGEGSLEAVVPNRLYFRRTQAGSGKEWKGGGRVRAGYVVEDREGNVLFANYDAWLELSQLVPGFAHGIQGMCVGEKRTLFVHPVYGYGALTTLPPCIGLVIKVHLLDVEGGDPVALPALEPLALEWIRDPGYYRRVEDAVRQQPRFVGAFYRDLLDKMKGLDKTALIEGLDSEMNMPH